MSGTRMISGMFLLSVSTFLEKLEKQFYRTYAPMVV